MATDLPIHAMKSAAGGTIATRCGFDVKAKGGGWTAWESLVTCAGCVDLRSPAQRTPDVHMPTQSKIDGLLKSAF